MSREEWREEERAAQAMELAREAAVEGCIASIRSELSQLSWRVNVCATEGEARAVALELDALAQSVASVAAIWDQKAWLLRENLKSFCREALAEVAR